MNLELIQTCSAFPEQYDVKSGKEVVGYMRLRHGYFYVSVPGPSGEIVYDANTEGDGIFEPEEREMHLNMGLKAIQWHYLKFNPKE